MGRVLAMLVLVLFGSHVFADGNDTSKVEILKDDPF